MQTLLLLLMLTTQPDYRASFYSADIHAWAVFTDGREYITISWYADHPRWLHLFPVRGRLRTWEETIYRARSFGDSIRCDGTIRISRETFERAKRQYARLERGEVAYRTINLLPCECAANCCDAFAAVFGVYATPFASGRQANREILRRIRR